MEHAKADTTKIIEKLTKLQSDMDYVREHIEDTTLTDEDISAIEEARNDQAEGTTRRL